MLVVGLGAEVAKGLQRCRQENKGGGWGCGGGAETEEQEQITEGIIPKWPVHQDIHHKVSHAQRH